MQIVVINKQHHRACMGNMQHGSGQTVNGKRYEIHCEISIKHFPSPPSHFHHSPFATLCTVHQKSIKTGILHFVCCHINLSLSLAQLAVLFFCCTLLVADAAEPETKPADAKAEPAVTTTKLTPSVEEPKSKTEKRDSSDQTGECEAVDTLFFVYHLRFVHAQPGSVYVTKPAKETPFRSSYASPATAPTASAAAAAAAYREAAESDSVFEPTTVRYSSVPQVSSNSSNINLT